MANMITANRYVTISNINEAEEKRNGIMARRNMMNIDDDRSFGTTQSADTVKRSNVMPSRAMTRGEAWNVIKQRNWVQQTIEDRDRRWCPTNID